jgi:hypothetical protein
MNGKGTVLFPFSRAAYERLNVGPLSRGPVVHGVGALTRVRVGAPHLAMPFVRSRIADGN